MIITSHAASSHDFSRTRVPAKSYGETSCLLVLPLVASCQIKPDDSLFVFYFSTHFDHIFFAGVFLFSSRNHQKKKKKKEKTLSDMIVAVRIFSIKGDMRTPVIFLKLSICHQLNKALLLFR